MRTLRHARPRPLFAAALIRGAGQLAALEALDIVDIIFSS